MQLTRDIDYQQLRCRTRVQFTQDGFDNTNATAPWLSDISPMQ